MRLRRRRAGRSGKQIWRANRRRAFRDAWRLNLFSLALVVGCAIAISYYEGFGELIFAAIIGAMLAIHAFVWTLGGHVGALRWIQGVWGEEATEEELEKLGVGWEVEHDIPRARGNWDHIAVSRAGVFALETKWTSSSAAVRGDELRFGRVAYSGAGFRGAAVDLKSELEAVTGHASWITSVVVIWGTFEQAFVEGDRVTYLSGERLADWLRGQPIRLSEGRAQELGEAVRSLRKRTLPEARLVRSD
ncbi:MAG: NERD domain-containing protein [Gaiellaceae bacterium]